MGFKTLYTNVYKIKGLKWFKDNFNNNILFFSMIESVVIYAYVFDRIIEYKDFKRDLVDIYTNCIGCILTYQDQSDYQKFMEWLSLNIQNIDNIEYLSKNYCYEEWSDEIITNLSKISLWDKNEKNVLDFFYKKQNNLDIFEEVLGERNLSTFEILERSKRDDELHTKIDLERSKDYFKLIRTAFIDSIHFSKDIEQNDPDILYANSYFDLLSEESIKAIKSTLSIFRIFNDFILSLYPFIPCLENELKENFIIPFHQSNYYPQTNTKFMTGYPLINNCDVKFQITCEQLKISNDRSKSNKKECITLKTYKFVKKYLVNYKKDKGDNILKCFAEFLGEKMEEFIYICDTLESWKIPNFPDDSLLTLRNPMMHGNHIDKYSNLTKDDFYKFWNFWVNSNTSIFSKIAHNSLKNRI